MKASDSLRTRDALSRLSASRPAADRVQDDPPDTNGIGHVAVHESTSPFQINAMLAVKSSTTALARRKEIAVMESCWIQRLNPSCQGHKFNEQITDPPRNQSHVWTHFTKDFSSSSKRLDKSPYHACSSSWPPQYLHTKKTAPNGFVEINANSRVEFVRDNDSNVCVPSQNATDESNLTSKAGRLFIGEEALVPRSWHGGPARDEASLACSNDDQVFAAQLLQLQSKDFNEESRETSPEMAAPARVSGNAYMHVNLESSKKLARMSHMGIFSLDTDVRASFSPAIMGASADADYRTVQPSWLNKDGNSLGNNVVGISSSFPSPPNYLLRSKADELADLNSRLGQTSFSENGKNFGFFRSWRYSKGFHSRPSQHLLSRSPCDVEASNRFYNSSRDVKHLASNTYPQGDKSRESYVCAKPYALENKGAPLSSKSSELRSGNDLLSIKGVKGIEASKVFLTRDTPDQHVSRARCKETSFEDYLEYFPRGQEHREPLETASSTASLPQEYITRQSNKPHISSIESSACFYGNKKVNMPQSCSLQATSNAHVEAFKSKSARPPLSPKNSLVQREQMGWGNKQCLGDAGGVGPDSDGGLHDIGQHLTHKDSRAVGFLFGHQSYKICNVERTCEASVPNQPWIKRWRSTSRFSVSSEKISSSPEADDTLGSKHPMAWNYKGKVASTKPCKNAGKSVEGCLEYASGSARKGPFPAYKSHNYTSFNSKYAVPSAQAMAVVDSVPSKLDATPLLNRGSVSIWPCPGANAVEQRRQGKHSAGASEDKLHVIDMDI